LRKFVNLIRNKRGKEDVLWNKENKGKEERKMKEMKKRQRFSLCLPSRISRRARRRKERKRKWKRESTYLVDSTASDFILKAKLRTAASSRSEII
jgi:hypothetical protein